MNTPVLFITFNRIDITRAVFEEIKKAKPLKLYLASDGARDHKQGEKDVVQEIREYLLSNIYWKCEVKTLFREKNLGCKNNVKKAIDWLFENEADGIIIEDDCLPSQDFFKFCEELLGYYSNDDRVGMISGFNPFSKKIKNRSSFFFSKYNLCWGWATWKRVWNEFDIDMKDWLIIRDGSFLREFSDDYLVREYWKNIFNIAFYCINDKIWDAQFSYLLFKKKSLTIVSSKNIIRNIGYGSELAVHCVDPAPKHIEELNMENLEYPLIYPAFMGIGTQWDGLVEKVHFDINLFTVLKFKIKVLLGRRYNKFLYKLAKDAYKKIK